MGTKPWICFPQEVNRREDFFGRQKILEDLTSDFQSSIIIGERKTGKTSTVNMVRLWCGDQGIIVNELSHPESARSLAASIANFLSLKLLGAGLVQTDYSRQFPLDDPETFELTFHSLVETLFARNPNARIMLILEEWDSLLRRVSPQVRHELRKFLEPLMVSRPGQSPLRMLLTMNKEPDDLLEDSRTPFEFSCKNVHLAPFDPTENTAFVNWLLQGRFQIEADIQEMIYRENGGHVYFTKSMVDQLLELFSDEPEGLALCAEHIGRAITHTLERNSGTDLTLKNIWDDYFSPVERDLVEESIEGIRHGDLESFDSEKYRALESLLSRNYIYWDSQREVWIIRHGILARWRQNRISYRLYKNRGEGSSETQQVPKPDHSPSLGNRPARFFSLHNLPHLVVDIRRKAALLGDIQLDLPPKEFLILACVGKLRGQVADRDTIANQCWPEHKQEFGIAPEMIDTAISGIRSHLRIALSQLLPMDSFTELDLRQTTKAYIETKPKFGYQGNPDLIELME